MFLQSSVASDLTSKVKILYFLSLTRVRWKKQSEECRKEGDKSIHWKHVKYNIYYSTFITSKLALLSCVIFTTLVFLYQWNYDYTFAVTPSTPKF